MKFISPAEIAAKIMTLMDVAEKEVVIISPYNKVTGWTKLEKHIRRLRERNVTLNWYIRRRVPNDDIKQIRDFGIEPVEIENLHAKIYFNEKYAIISSMNLHRYSDEYSLDIAYMTETDAEYAEVIGFYQTYVLRRAGIQKLEHTSDMNHDQPLVRVLQDEIRRLIKDPTKSDMIREYNHGFFCESIFVAGLSIVFVDKKSWFRFSFDFDQITMSSQQKTALYSHLHAARDRIENALGFAVAWGGQMKRIKIDFDDIQTGDSAIASQSDVEKVFLYLNRCISIIIPEVRKYIALNEITCEGSNDVSISLEHWLAHAPFQQPVSNNVTSVC